MQELSWLIHPLLLSAKTLAITFVLLLFLGLGAAYFLAFYRGRFKALLEAAVMFPLIFPPIATGFLLLYILGRNGALGKALNLQIVFSFSALVIASFLAGLPLFVKPVQSALESLSKSLIEAAPGPSIYCFADVGGRPPRWKNRGADSRGRIDRVSRCLKEDYGCPR